MATEGSNAVTLKKVLKDEGKIFLSTEIIEGGFKNEQNLLLRCLRF